MNYSILVMTKQMKYSKGSLCNAIKGKFFYNRKIILHLKNMGTIVKEIDSGYTLKGRVLKVAKVILAKGTN